jgi:tetratricopeptide (TPR) repeat protein
MRFLVFLRSYGLLILLAFLIGIIRPPLKPEQVSAPKTAEDFVYRGELYAKQEKYEKALEDYRQAEQLHPADRHSIYHRIYLN